METTMIAYNALPEVLGPEPSLPIYHGKGERGKTIIEAYVPDCCTAAQLTRCEERLRAMKGVIGVEIFLVSDIPAERLLLERP